MDFLWPVVEQKLSRVTASGQYRASDHGQMNTGSTRQARRQNGSSLERVCLFVVCWLLNVPATCVRDGSAQLDVLPH